MEALTRLVIDSLSRHGFDRPIDPRRLQWSSWFRCDSPHSLLVVPSKPGIFAIAEEILDFGNAHVGTAVPGCPAEQSSAAASSAPAHATAFSGGAALQRSDSLPAKDTALAAEPTPTKRMLAVPQFAEDDDMAFTLDRMFTRINPMRARLTSGSCFLRFVVIEDQAQRRSICSALNQWMLSSAEKASGFPAGFSSSLEVSALSVTQATAPASAAGAAAPVQPGRGADVSSLPHLGSGASKNLHCPHPLPSGF
jgi:hypothetical protein